VTEIVACVALFVRGANYNRSWMKDFESERLNSWKEIAAHLKVSVRTAERWEKTERLGTGTSAS
jgi:hypothetical protein